MVNDPVNHTRTTDDAELDLRPLRARSMIASTLLGTHPPRLPTRVLVAAAGLFGVSDSAARTALSRMVAAGELVATDGAHTLTGQLLERQQRQDVGRSAARVPWTGDWLVLILDGSPRSASERARRRKDLGLARLGEARDGVWVRPNNLGSFDAGRLDGATLGRFTEAAPADSTGLVDGAHGENTADEFGWDVGRLWDLDLLDRQARGLSDRVATLTPGLERGDETLLAQGFVVAAAVLRWFQHDPLLPDELLPGSWAGVDLRSTYDGFDLAYRSLLRDWFRAQRD